ncbi:MAG: type II secretion system F family protein [Desulfovibrio sp.]|nr:type II secretion system F family protein [Desulfovibrio sp.]
MFAKVVFLGGAARARLYEALAGHMDNGLPELEALRLLRTRTHKDDKRQKRILDEAIAAMEAGAPLSQALKNNVPDMEYMLLAAGDNNGRPSETLKHLAELVTMRGRVLTAVRGALSYPLFLLFFFVGLLLTVSFFVVPAFTTLVPAERWFGFARLLRDVADFTASWKSLALFLSILACVFLMLWSLPRWTGKIRAIADHFPPWSLYRLLTSAVWIFTLGALLQGGLRADDAIKLSLEGSPSSWLKGHLQKLYAFFAQGNDLGETLAHAPESFMEKDMAQELAFYAALPHFAQRLPLLADQWLKRRVSQVEVACRKLNAFGILCIFFLLTLVGLAIWDLITVLSQGTNLF